MICEQCGAQLQKRDTGYECPECGIQIADTIDKSEDLKSYAAMTVGGIVLAAICRWAVSSGYVLTILGIRLGFALPVLTFVFAGVALLSAAGLVMTYFEIGDSNDSN